MTKNEVRAQAIAEVAPKILSQFPNAVYIGTNMIGFPTSVEVDGTPIYVTAKIAVAQWWDSDKRSAFNFDEAFMENEIKEKERAEKREERQRKRLEREQNPEEIAFRNTLMNILRKNGSPMMASEIVLDPDCDACSVQKAVISLRVLCDEGSLVKLPKEEGDLAHKYWFPENA